MTNILTVNPGSTSVKYAVFASDGQMIERVAFDRKDTKSATDKERAWLSSLADIEMVAIRIVHGGDMAGPIALDTDVKMRIKELARFAPIHNGLALEVIALLQEALPGVNIIASFDTDFHKTMPESTSTYPIPTALASELNIKRYGFHGLVLRSVLQQLQKTYRGPTAISLPSKVICAHLGGGCSITAVKDGKSVDTTMGLTPLEGIMMTTRSGSIGPGVVEYIAEQKGWTTHKVVEVLNRESGFYGLTGSKNTQDIIERASKHQEPEKLAFDIFVSQIVKRIFAYYGTLQGCDALTFSGGIGQGNEYLRTKALEQLKIIGIDGSNTFVFEVDEAGILFEDARKFM